MAATTATVAQIMFGITYDSVIGAADDVGADVMKMPLTTATKAMIRHQSRRQVLAL